jgi:protein-S-isoprenylcysteine O-methyltransferase Ste14
MRGVSEWAVGEAQWYRLRMAKAQPSPVNLEQVQLVRKGVLLAVVAGSFFFLFLGESRWPSGFFVHETIEWMGIGLILFCVVGRTWCSIYIGGRKVQALVTVGPYSVSRNPLYFFSVLGAAGAGAQLGSFVLALVAGLLAWAVFFVVVHSEEAALSANFGEVYRQYMARVPRFFPKLTLWRDAEKIEVRPQLIVRTFIDACVFFLAIPVAEGFEYLHGAGFLPTLFTLP